LLKWLNQKKNINVYINRLQFNNVYIKQMIPMATNIRILTWIIQVLYNIHANEVLNSIEILTTSFDLRKIIDTTNYIGYNNYKIV
jgi:hypothetical protein